MMKGRLCQMNTETTVFLGEMIAVMLVDVDVDVSLCQSFDIFLDWKISR